MIISYIMCLVGCSGYSLRKCVCFLGLGIFIMNVMMRVVIVGVNIIIGRSIVEIGLVRFCFSYSGSMII